MTTVFRRCLLANYAIAPDALAAVLPQPLVPDLAADSAWLSVVIADMARMRPAGIPASLGVSYRQVVYRAVVRCGRDRGVYFLRSDADSRFMNAGGNLLSFFRFHYAPVTWTHDVDGDRVRVLSRSGSADIDMVLGPAAPAGPAAVGAFPGLAGAKEHLVNLFSAFHPRDGHIDVVDIERSDWPITITPAVRAHCAFLEGAGPFPTGASHLDSVFLVTDLPYYWHRLRTVPMSV
ncbi:MAG TPA: DUF2071 domain-containing protein [Streptosporangiaceae bacterium]|nr:DUF2071 domain-containing protein [Streptosporangiaceae bacterium]